MAAGLAALPLLAVLLGMTALGWSAALAGGAGLLIATGLVVAGLSPASLPGGTLAGAGGTLAEALFSTLTILWIILPALILFEFQNRTGAIGRIRAALGGLTEDARVQVILIAWFFGLFIEGAAGFGTPVALSAPLLVGMGHAPARAVVLALLGHASGVTFGAVGTPTLTQIEISGLAPTSLAGTVAVLNVLPGLLLLLATVRLAAPGPIRGSDYGWSALAAVSFFVPSILLAAFVGPEVPSLAGALIGAVVFVLILRRKGGRSSVASGLLADLAPYLMIVGLVLLTRAGLVAAGLLTGRAGALAPSVHDALRRLVPVALALTVMLSLSRLMVHAGMIGELATTAALAGGFWPLVAPMVGVLGSFITGSATASNILFTDLQLSVARDLGLPDVLMTAAQGFGAAFGNVVAPHNIIAGCATVGLAGREGEILRGTALPALLAIGIGGALVFFFA